MKIALLGFGVVGQGFYEIFKSQQQSLIDEFQQPIELGKILIRSKERYDHYKNLPFTDHFQDILDYKPDVVISVMGGIEPAYSYAQKLMINGAAFITSNKDLVASHYNNLHLIAKENHVRLLFEASVCGAIPLLKTIREDLRGNLFMGFQGIVNGTTNYILSSMANDQISYKEALALAQVKGFAEKDPTSDVEGKDAIRKTTILVNQLFNQSFIDHDLSGTGITKLPEKLIQFTRDNKVKIKLLAYGFKNNQKLHAGVRPVLVCPSHPLYHVDYEMNQVAIKGHACGKISLTGSGAGKLTTGSAVFSDLYDYLLKPNQMTYHQPLPPLDMDDGYESEGYFLSKDSLNQKEINHLLKSDIVLNCQYSEPLIQASGEEKAKAILNALSKSPEIYLVLC